MVFYYNQKYDIVDFSLMHNYNEKMISRHTGVVDVSVVDIKSTLFPQHMMR